MIETDSASAPADSVDMGDGPTPMHLSRDDVAGILQRRCRQLERALDDALAPQLDAMLMHIEQMYRIVAALKVAGETPTTDESARAN